MCETRPTGCDTSLETWRGVAVDVRVLVLTQSEDGVCGGLRDAGGGVTDFAWEGLLVAEAGGEVVEVVVP